MDKKAVSDGPEKMKIILRSRVATLLRTTPYPPKLGEIMKAKETAYQRFRESQRSLLQIIKRNYGQQLDVFLPQVLTHFRQAKRVANPVHVAHLLADAATTDGTPALAGKPYASRLTPKFLAYLIMCEGWIPDNVPPIPNPTSGSTEDVSDSAEEAREASTEYRKTLGVSERSNGQDTAMPCL